MSFQEEQDKIVKNLNGVESLLLHSCCGPCSSYCIEALSEYFEVTVLWYNSNIHPQSEYDLRLENQKKLISNIETKNPVHLLELEYDPESYFDLVRGLENEPEGGKRCTQCFIQRLERAAKETKERGFNWFTTTLTVSPHKNAPLINEIGNTMAERYGVRFLPSDFKKRNGYKRSIELSKMYDLYRQNYCGCIYSIRGENKDCNI